MLIEYVNVHFGLCYAGKLVLLSLTGSGATMSNLTRSIDRENIVVLAEVVLLCFFHICRLYLIQFIDNNNNNIIDSYLHQKIRKGAGGCGLLQGDSYH